MPFTPSEARAFVDEIISRMEILPLPPSAVRRWTELAERHSITGTKVFDLQLAATMIENGVKRIYTYNRADFEIVPDLQVLTPEDPVRTGSV